MRFVIATIVILVISAVLAGRPVDYIVIGGGAGGAVIANRLSANPENDVLLIDLGKSTCAECDASLGASANTASPYANLPLPVQQAYLKFVRQPALYQFRGVGGSTKSFGGVHTMPSREFIDSYFPASYNYDNLLPHFKATQDHYCHYLPQNITGISPADCVAWHGKDGEMQSVPQMKEFLGSNVIPALGEYLGTRADIGNSTDYNNPNTKRGFAYEQRWGRAANKSDVFSARSRMDVQHAFLPTSLVQSRPNLQILEETRVLRLLTKLNRIIGVEVFDGVNIDVIRARKHVFLCAGVLDTPKILELSGIGDPQILAQHGIQVVANNTAVGANLRSHQAMIVSYRTKTPISPDLSKTTYNAAQIFLNISGDSTRASNFQVELLNGFYVDSVEGYADGLPDELVQAFLQGQQTGFPFVACEIEHHAPTAIGSAHIQSANPLTPVRFDFGWGFNLFFAPDIPKFLQAIAKVREIFLGNNSFAQQHIAEEVWPGNIYRDFYIKQGITQEPMLTNLADTLALQNRMTHFYHVTGTCALGQCTDLYGQVRGVEGLSVCDLSVLPENPDANPTTTLVAVCDKMVKDHIARQQI